MTHPAAVWILPHKATTSVCFWSWLDGPPGRHFEGKGFAPLAGTRGRGMEDTHIESILAGDFDPQPPGRDFWGGGCRGCHVHIYRLCLLGAIYKHVGVLFGCSARQIDGDSWFAWWFNHLPGPSISPKRTPIYKHQT